MAIHDSPTFTVSYENVAAYAPPDGAIYISGASTEARSRHIDTWRDAGSSVTYIAVDQQDSSSFAWHMNGANGKCFLRSNTSIQALLQSIPKHVVVIDMTGLIHSVWAPLIRAALELRREAHVVYVEPSDYKKSVIPTEGVIFDLSERICGVSPLPGFASLTEPDPASVYFVPLLGFEGARLLNLLDEVQPPADHVLPIIGVPGFRAEYPFYTYIGNRRPLTRGRCWQMARFITANCPFACFNELDRILKTGTGRFLKIAPIGTKPHALGAVLFSLARADVCELVYDHPVRKAERTEGTGRLLSYGVSAFLSGLTLQDA